MAASKHDDSDLISGINVTPLVDVVLVLLVVLMVTASAIAAQAIEVDLPRAASGQAQAPGLVLTLTATGQLRLNDETLSWSELRPRLRRARREQRLQQATIAADGTVPHRQVVRLVDALRLEGIQRFALSVQPAVEGP